MTPSKFMAVGSNLGKLGMALLIAVTSGPVAASDLDLLMLDFETPTASTGVAQAAPAAPAEAPAPAREPEAEEVGRSEVAAPEAGSSTPALDFPNPLNILNQLNQKSFEISSRKPHGDKDHVVINTCSKTAKYKGVFSESFHWYSDARRKRGKTNQECDQQGLQMNKSLADFMEKNFDSCVQSSALAAGIETHGIGGHRIIHDGCIGDASHQARRSWHNDGTALDINAIEVGGQLLKYKDARAHQEYDYEVKYVTKTKWRKGKKISYQKKVTRKIPKAGGGTAKNETTAKFFKAFRSCWGNRVANSGYKNCSKKGKFSGYPVGSIGNEDKSHQYHLHISLPCKDSRVADEFGPTAALEGIEELMNGNIVIETAEMVMADSVEVATRGLASLDMVERAPAKRKTDKKAQSDDDGNIDVVSVQVDVNREVHAFIENRGEPVGRPIAITVKQVCKTNPDKSGYLAREISACAFESFTGSTEGRLKLVYRVGEMKDGRVSCSNTQTQEFENICK